MGQSHIELDKLKKRVKVAIHAHNQSMLKIKDLSEDVIDMMVDVGDTLTYVQNALEKVLIPSIDQIKDHVLEGCDERIKEASNYRAGQSELEKLLQEKISRGESLNQYLIGSSYAIRRAAKTVMKRNK